MEKKLDNGNEILARKIAAIYIKTFIFICSQVSFILLIFFTEISLTWIMISAIFLFLSYSIMLKDLFLIANKRIYILVVVLIIVISIIVYTSLHLLINKNSYFFLLITTIETLLMVPKIADKTNE